MKRLCVVVPVLGCALLSSAAFADFTYLNQHRFVEAFSSSQNFVNNESLYQANSPDRITAPDFGPFSATSSAPTVSAYGYSRQDSFLEGTLLRTDMWAQASNFDETPGDGVYGLQSRAQSYFSVSFVINDTAPTWWISYQGAGIRVFRNDIPFSPWPASPLNFHFATLPVDDAVYRIEANMFQENGFSRTIVTAGVPSPSVLAVLCGMATMATHRRRRTDSCA
jgi:hypothetical protein